MPRKPNEIPVAAAVTGIVATLTGHAGCAKWGRSGLTGGMFGL
jgi:hypothetical protein